MRAFLKRAVAIAAATMLMITGFGAMSASANDGDPAVVCGVGNENLDVCQHRVRPGTYLYWVEGTEFRQPYGFAEKASNEWIDMRDFPTSFFGPWESKRFTNFDAGRNVRVTVCNYTVDAWDIWLTEDIYTDVDKILTPSGNWTDRLEPNLRLQGFGCAIWNRVHVNPNDGWLGQKTDGFYVAAQNTMNHSQSPWSRGMSMFGQGLERDPWVRSGFQGEPNYIDGGLWYSIEQIPVTSNDGALPVMKDMPADFYANSSNHYSKYSSSYESDRIATKGKPDELRLSVCNYGSEAVQFTVFADIPGWFDLAWRGGTKWEDFDTDIWGTPGIPVSARTCVQRQFRASVGVNIWIKDIPTDGIYFSIHAPQNKFPGNPNAVYYRWEKI